MSLCGSVIEPSGAPRAQPAIAPRFARAAGGFARRFLHGYLRGPRLMSSAEDANPGGQGVPAIATARAGRGRRRCDPRPHRCQRPRPADRRGRARDRESGRWPRVASRSSAPASRAKFAASALCERPGARRFAPLARARMLGNAGAPELSRGARRLACSRGDPLSRLRPCSVRPRPPAVALRGLGRRSPAFRRIAPLDPAAPSRVAP